jgi:hypothetical protein
LIGTAQTPPLTVSLICLLFVPNSAFFVSSTVDALIATSLSQLETVIAAVGEPLTANNNTGRAGAPEGSCSAGIAIRSTRRMGDPIVRAGLLSL